MHGNIKGVDMPEVNRRQFIKAGVMALPFVMSGVCPVTAGILSSAGSKTNVRGKIFKNDAPDTPGVFSKPASFQRVLSENKIMCTLCPNQCILSSGDRGICRSRVNVENQLYSISYGNPCAVHVDPVEKKPLYHFKPQSNVFSIACAGCNFRCLNCQNWEISQSRPEEMTTYRLFPDDVVEKTLESGSSSIAYTYSEPTTFYEYMLDTARLARDSGLSNIWISNGYINTEPLDRLCRVLDAANVNLKAFSDKVYLELNGGRLQPVLDTFELLNRRGIHFEITHLVVPGYTDQDIMMKQMVEWILSTLGPMHPLHFLRFFPHYRLNRLRPTPEDVLTRFRQTAMDMGMKYVYVGNVPEHEGNHTYCHACGKLVVERKGYRIMQFHIQDSKCRFCGETIPGIWHDRVKNT